MGNSASADTQRYLDGYPGEPDDKSQSKNIDFYSNKRSSKPEGDTIENIHKKWKENYGLLEAHHGYIQWLFPIREDGLNHHAQRLQLHEAKSISSDPILQGRVITSYELMLDFYGMQLLDRTTGAVARAENWKQRYSHLNRSFHNYLRITRILKCLGEIDLEHFKIHFVTHILKETYENKQLVNCHESCVKYWVPILRNEADKEQVKKLIDDYEEARPTRHNRSASTSDDDESRKKIGRIDIKNDEDRTPQEIKKSGRVSPETSGTSTPEIRDSGRSSPDIRDSGRGSPDSLPHQESKDVRSPQNEVNLEKHSPPKDEVNKVE